MESSKTGIHFFEKYTTLLTLTGWSRNISLKQYILLLLTVFSVNFGSYCAKHKNNSHEICYTGSYYAMRPKNDAIKG